MTVLFSLGVITLECSCPETVVIQVMGTNPVLDLG